MKRKYVSPCIKLIACRPSLFIAASGDSTDPTKWYDGSGNEIPSDPADPSQDGSRAWNLGTVWDE